MLKKLVVFAVLVVVGLTLMATAPPTEPEDLDNTEYPIGPIFFSGTVPVSD